MGTRENAAAQDFSGIPLEEEEESHLKDAAVISMGTEISLEDMMNIEALCDQVRLLLLFRLHCATTLFQALHCFYICLCLSFCINSYSLRNLCSDRQLSYGLCSS